MQWLKTLKNNLRKPGGIPAGTFTATCYTQQNVPYKLMLRVDEKGLGRLILNARTVLFLNETSTEYMYHYLLNQYGDKVVGFMQAKYKISRQEILKDYESLVNEIEALLGQEDLNPLSRFQGVTSAGNGDAPQKVDLYPTLAMPGDPVSELQNLQWWQNKMRSLVAIGVPHFILVGGEPLVWDGTVPLIQTSEELGVVAGLVCHQSALSTQKLDELISAGLDHLCLLVPPSELPNWQLLDEIAKKDLYFQLVWMVSNQNLSQVKLCMPQCRQVGANNISFEVIEAMEQAGFDSLFDAVDDSGLTFVPFAEMVCRDGCGDDLQRYADASDIDRVAHIVLPNGNARSLTSGIWRDVIDQ